jgi:glucose-fructose oxidoreductase
MATEVMNNEADPNRKKIRYAVVGLGYIAQAAVLPAFQHAAENSELTALISGDPEKLHILAERYKVAHTYSYGQYTECLESGVVDAVYIALPNHLHREYSEAAARARVHVLCEKPMAVTELECEAMIESAKAFDVKLMIAYRLHFEPANLRAIEIVNSSKLGEPRIFNSVFSQPVKAGDIRLLNQNMGGGPLYDLGVYCINAARYLFRSEPKEVFAASAKSADERFTEVDEMVSAVMRFPENRLATFTCSFGATDCSTYEVLGTEGKLRLDPAYEFARDLRHILTIGDKTEERIFPKSDQFAPELLYFSDCILKNRVPEPSGYEGLADVRIIRAMLESAQKRRPRMIKGLRPTPKPTPDQEIVLPPVEKPELVKAASPSGR